MNKVNIIITHKCNLMCKHCYMNAGNKEFEDCDIIFDKFKNTIQKIKAMNINEVMLTGGECTISPLFLKMLQYCKENEIKPSIFTNGFAFNHEILNYVDSYCLSLDGLESNHNYLRGNSMGFRKTIDTIKYLQLNKKSVTIQVTVTKNNLNEISDVIDLLNSLKVKNINLCCLLDEGRSINNNLDSSIDLKLFNSIIEDCYRKTGYNIKIHSNVFNKIDTKIFLRTKSIIFPLWIDLINDSFYLIKDHSIFSRPLNQLSIKNVRDLNELVNNYILSDFSKYSTKKYYILENEVLSQLLGGDDKNE